MAKLDEPLKPVERVPTSLLPDPDPRPLWCPIISVDDHLLEPPELFVDRLPSSMRDRAPFVEFDDAGIPFWVIDDVRVAVTTGNGAVGRPVSEWIQAPQKYEEFRRAVWDPHERIRDMDINGVYASLNFPSMIWGFAGTRFSRMSDPDVGLAALRAYNDWVLEEWCGSHPDRFIPCQLTWLSDPEVGADEIRRNASRGFRALSFSENPEGLGYPTIYDSHWDPILRVCEETDTVINLHVGSSGNVQRPTSDSGPDVGVALFPVNGLFALMDWIFAKVPIRFPGLKIAMSEAGVSWIPMAIERLRRAHRMREASTVWDATDGDPVELVYRNFWFTSIEDPSAFRQLDMIGEDKIMIESDYPHYDSSWPDTQLMVKDQLEHLPSSSVRRICYENAAELYHHPHPPPSLLQASTIGGPS